MSDSKPSRHAGQAHGIDLRRIYAEPGPANGRRILVDRIWPRGVAKADAHIDDWLRDVAPSTELRRWFGHDPSRWDEFRQRYRAELDADPDVLDQLLNLARDHHLTLVYSARDEAHNQAVILKEVLEERLGRR